MDNTTLVKELRRQAELLMRVPEAHNRQPVMTSMDDLRRRRARRRYRANLRTALLHDGWAAALRDEADLVRMARGDLLLAA